MELGLDKGFRNPPVSAKPWVYWSWMNGNITKEGITADLEAMQRVGIGGALVINLSLSIPEGPVLPFMGPAWLDMLRFAATEAARLNMEMALYVCDGWQLAGGPSITPETAMKKVVSTEIHVQGPRRIETVLEQPRTNLDYYRDIAVLAFPTPFSRRINGLSAGVTVTSSIKDCDLTPLIDDNPQTLVSIPSTMDGHPEFIQFEFDKPHCVQTAVFHIPTDGLGAGIAFDPPATVELQTTGPSGDFSTVASFEIDWERSRYGTPTVTIGFDAQPSRRFRFVFSGIKAFKLGDVELLAEPRIRYWEAKAGMARRRQHGGETFAFAAENCMSAQAAGPADAADGEAPAVPLQPGSIIDLTGSMSSDGRLAWDIPEGDWTIIRVGFTATGAYNSPATRGGRGLECDKLSPKGIETLFPNVVGAAMKELQTLPDKVMGYVHSDSWEVGEQNWTQDFPAEFAKRRGYDLRPYLPVMATGRVVGSYDASERFLRDFRRTIADLIADCYHQRLRELCHEVGLEYESEAAGRQQFMYDAIGYFSKSDVPMGEFWRGPEWYNGVRVDCRAAASVAHTYGKRYVAAESFTSHWEHARWSDDLYSFKALGDEAFCTGVNRFVFHRYAHQPYDIKPGLTYGPWGIHFERTNTWWEQGKSWVTYLGRCQWLLQEGRFVADVIHYIGDEIPNYLGHRDELWSPVPEGYDYDGCNTEILMQMQVEDGYITLPTGMKYRVLMLPNSRVILPAALRKIRDLAHAGATIIGPKPQKSPSMQGYPECDSEIALLADELWGDCGESKVKEDSCGRGRVICDRSVAEVLAEMNVAPDFSYKTVLPESSAGEAEIRYIHRTAADADVYFIANGKDQATEALCTFRVKGKRPELWRPVEGTFELLPVYTEVPEGIQAPIHFEPSGSTFVVFRHPIQQRDQIVALTHNAAPASVALLTARDERNVELLAFEPGKYELALASGRSVVTQIEKTGERVDIPGPWELSFPPNWGAPEKVVLDSLISWTEHDNPGVKYFSGTATYVNEFSIPSTMLDGSSVVFLDLGLVKNIAEVQINAQNLGVLWKPPFHLDITPALRPGTNRLAISITNLWANRLIGDEQLPDDCELRDPAVRPTPLAKWPEWFLKGQSRPSGRYTLVSWRHYRGDSPLLASGLLGPVALHVAKRVAVRF